VLTELFANVQSRCDGLDILDLSLGNDFVNVVGPALDQRHERSMAQWSIWTAEREMVREVWNSKAEVGRHSLLAAPDVTKVFAVGDERESRNPGCVETGGADYYVNFIGGALMVYEACRRDSPNRISECGHIWGH